MPDLARLLDLDFSAFTDDLEFYQHMAERAGGPLLELGVGAGRVAVPLARAGHDVCGIDTAEAMLERARCHAGDLDTLRLACADMRDFDLGARFAMAYAAFGTFHHLLSLDDQRACLRAVRRHLEPGALLVFDLRPLLESVWEPGDSVPLLHDWTRTLENGEAVTKLRAVRVNRATQVQHETHLYDIASEDGTLRRVTAAVDLRFSTRYEIEVLLHEAGFQIEQLYGDFDLSPYEDGSPYLITVARAGATR